MGLVKNLALMAYISVGCSLSPILVSFLCRDVVLYLQLYCMIFNLFFPPLKSTVVLRLREGGS